MFIYYLFLTMLSSIASCKKCAHFEFQSFPDLILRKNEGKLVNFTFVLNISVTGCPRLSEIGIDRYFKPICKIRLNPNSCKPSSLYPMCGCTTAKNIFWFSKVLDTSDSTTWKWSAFDEQLLEVAVEQLAFVIRSYQFESTFIPDQIQIETEAIDVLDTEQLSSSNSSNGIMVTVISVTASVICINAVIVGVIISINRAKVSCFVERIWCPALTTSVKTYNEDTNNAERSISEGLPEIQTSVIIPDLVFPETCQEEPKVTFYQDGSDLNILICIKGYPANPDIIKPNTKDPSAMNEYLTPCPPEDVWENDHNYEKI